MSLDLLIIHPGAARDIAGGHPVYGDLSASLVAIEPSMWSRILAAYARDEGYRVAIIDAEADHLNPWQAARRAELLRPKLVCFAAYGHNPNASTQQMDGTITTARRIKSLCDIPIIVVGGHVSALPERTLRDDIAFDYACVGEGPVTISGLLGGDDPTDIPGLVWRNEGNIIVNERAPLVDMDRLHGDAWDLLVPLDRYQGHNWQCMDGSPRSPYASIHTTLNCPYACHFCCISAPFGNNVYRRRDPQQVVDEIVRLHRDYGVCTFKIIDELFVLNPHHYVPICEGLVASGISDRLNIWCYARPDSIKADTLPLLRKAGIRWLALGIESGNKRVRVGARKDFKHTDVKQVVRTIQSHDISVIGNYIFGLPDDDMESMQETLDLALDLNTEFANFYSAQAYPGSPLYAEAVAKGWTLPETWSGFSQHGPDCRPLDTRHVDAATVLRFRDHAFQTYFISPRYLDMVRAKFGAAAVGHVKQMATYRLRRKLLEQDVRQAVG